MKNNKTLSYVRFVITFALSALLLTGCGASRPAPGVVKDDPVGNSNVMSSKTADDTEKLESKRITNEDISRLVNETDGVVKLTVWASEEDQNLTQMILDDFEDEYPMISFDITLGCESEGTAKDTVLEDIEGAADVFTFADDQISDLVYFDALCEINDGYTYNITESNVPASVEAATVDGKLYAYPMTADNGYFMFYDKSVFSQSDTSSLEKMIEKADEAGKKIGMHITNGWYLYSFFKGAGYKLELDRKGNNICDWNSEGGTDVAKAIMDAVATGVFVNMDDATMVSGLEEGTLAALVSGTWRAADVQKAFGNNYGACKLPTVKIGGKDIQMASFSGCKLVGVNKRSENTQWAMLLAEYLTNEKSQERRYEARLLGPSNIAAQSSDAIKNDPAMAALSAQYEYASPQRVGQNYWSPSKDLGTALVSKKTKESDLQKLLDKTVEEITAPVEKQEQ